MSVGDPIDRVDGPVKVRGRARYSAEWPTRGMTYAVLVVSRIASGRVKAIDSSAASRAAGVIAILTHENAPELPAPASGHPIKPVLSVLQDDVVWYQNQPIAVVVADTFERATYAASLVDVSYDTSPAVTDMGAALDSAFPPAAVNGQSPDSLRGDPAAGMQAAHIRVEQTYTTPIETHNPMEPHATIAVWDETGTGLTLYSSTQGVWPERRAIAARFGLPVDKVRVVTKYLGGGFGCKGTAWSHVVIAVMAAKHVKRPVKLVLARAQMFGPVGYRPRTVQRIALGATADGKFTSLRHDGISQTSQFDEWVEPVAATTRSLYSCPNIGTSHRLVRVNAGTPWYTRAPGEASGLFALESALDELAYALPMDPVELRLRNYAERDESKDRPWSSKALRECYRVGAERFGWTRRTAEPRSMRDGDVLVGMGMATAARGVNRAKSSARARLLPDGTVTVQAGTQDIGTGTYTIMSQIAADALGLPVRAVKFELGDTDYPETPVSAGSLTATSTGPAVQAACADLRNKLVQIAVTDRSSPLHGADPASIEAHDGRLVAVGSSRADSYRQILARHGLQYVDGQAETAPGSERDTYSMFGFGSIFAEVRVDPDFGTVRVSRLVGVYGAGRILNAKTARSQLIGGMVWGLGMALLEDTVFDHRSGRVVNGSLAEYLVPVEADVPDLDASFVEEHDPYVNPLGAKGIGEIGITGVAPAIANAVYHATGVRVRDLPITLDKVMGSSTPAGAV